MREIAEDTWTIRLAKVDELGALGAIERDAAISLRDAGVSLPDGDDTLPRNVLEKSQADNLLFVAVDARERPVAFLVCSERDGGLYIGEVDVERVWQRRGIGRALVNHALDEARVRGLWGAMLTTDRFAPFNAPFYATAGFVEPSPQDMPPGLAATLATEAAEGHDPARRVGMVLRFS
jgi:GNAT superfamily N-acetyltransferase